MVKHIILWQLKDELTPSEKEIRKQKIKESLESLPGKVPGLLELKVNINPLPSSNADLMLDSTMENVQKYNKLKSELVEFLPFLAQNEQFMAAKFEKKGAKE